MRVLNTERFQQIYDENLWGGGSGDGSRAEATVEYRKVLVDIIKKYNIKSVLDYGCGDWEFSKLIDWNNLVDSYYGVDVVSSVIESNKQKYEQRNIKFDLLTNDWNMPNVDLIICKDVFQHLPNSIVVPVLSEMRNSSKFMLLTNDILYPGNVSVNGDCDPGGMRPLNFSIEPWNISPIFTHNWGLICEAIKVTILIQGINTI